MFAKKYKGNAIDTAELLGPPTDPKNLSMSALQDTKRTKRAARKRGETRGSGMMTFWRNNCWQETCFSYLKKRGLGSCFNSGFDMFHFVHCGHWPFFKPLDTNQYTFFDHLVRSCIIIKSIVEWVTSS